MNIDRIEELKAQLADLKQRWPAHSVPPVMMEQLDALEEELSRELGNRNGSVDAFKIELRVFRVREIGRVENEFDEPTAPDVIRSRESKIILDPSLVDGLQGFEPGNKLMVIFYFHRSDGYELFQHPRGDQNRSIRGVFSLCSPQRPNPIGVAVVDLLSIDENILRVTGLDALNDTPVLDLKPV